MKNNNNKYRNSREDNQKYNKKNKRNKRMIMTITFIIMMMMEVKNKVKGIIVVVVINRRKNKWVMERILHSVSVRRTRLRKLTKKSWWIDLKYWNRKNWAEGILLKIIMKEKLWIFEWIYSSTSKYKDQSNNLTQRLKTDS